MSSSVTLFIHSKIIYFCDGETELWLQQNLIFLASCNEVGFTEALSPL